MPNSASAALAVIFAFLLLGNVTALYQTRFTFEGYSGISSQAILGANETGGILLPLHSQSAERTYAVFMDGKVGTGVYMNEAYYLAIASNVQGVPSSSLMNAKTSETLLLAMWIKPVSTGTETMTLISKLENTGDDMLGWTMDIANRGDVRYSIFGSRKQSSVHSVRTKEYVPRNSWTHVAAVITQNAETGHATAELYFNGTRIEVVETHNSYNAARMNALENSGDVVIGARHPSGSSGCSTHQFQGLLDNIVLIAGGDDELEVLRNKDIASLQEQFNSMGHLSGQCSRDPCVRGFCHLVDGIANCQCPEGWEGATCNDSTSATAVPFSPFRIDPSILEDVSASMDPCATFNLMKQMFQSNMEFEIDGLDRLSKLMSERLKQNANVTSISPNKLPESQQKECGHSHPNEPQPREGFQTASYGSLKGDAKESGYDLFACPAAREWYQMHISRIPKSFSFAMDKQTADLVQELNELLLSLMNSSVSTEKSRRLLGAIEIPDILLKPLSSNATIQEAWAKLNTKMLLSTPEFDNMEFRQDMSQYSASRKLIPSMCWSGKCWWQDDIVPEISIPRLEIPELIRSSPLASPTPSPSPSQSPSASPQFKEGMTSQEAECLEYRNEAVRLGAQRLYQNVPVSQFYVKEFCDGIVDFTITHLTYPMVVGIYEIDVGRNRASYQQTASWDELPLSFRSRTAPQECVRVIVAPISEYHTGAMDIEVSGNACGLVTGPCEPFSANETHALAYHPVDLNIGNLPYMHESNNFGENRLQVAFTRKSYELRYQTAVPIVAFDEEGNLQGYDANSGIGNQGRLTYTHRMTRVAILGPVSPEAIQWVHREQVCSVSSEEGYVVELCNRPTPEFLMSRVPAVNVLVNDYVDDGDDDGLGARLEAQLCTCDPGSYELKWICPPGYSTTEHDCFYTGIGGAPDTNSKPGRGVSRWYSYCEELLGRFDRGNGISRAQVSIQPLEIPELFEDTDGDGLDDGDEVLGAAIRRTPGVAQEMIPGAIMLNLMGAHPTQKDVFVEFDLLMDREFQGVFAVNPLSLVGTYANLTGYIMPFWRSLYFNQTVKMYSELKAEHVLNPNGRDGIRPHFDVGHDPRRSGVQMLSFYTQQPGHYNFAVDRRKCVVHLQMLGIVHPRSEEIDDCEAAAALEIQMYEEGVFGHWGGGSTLVSEEFSSRWCSQAEYPVSTSFMTAQNYDECVEFLQGSKPNFIGFTTAMQDYRKRYFRYGIGYTLPGGWASRSWMEFNMVSSLPLPHELGHTMGLGHGGPLYPKNRDDTFVNCHPFYVSPMNYVFSFDPDIRFFQEDPGRFNLQPVSMKEWQFLEEDLPESWSAIMDRAPGALRYGRNFTGSGDISVDWNHDGFISILKRMYDPAPTVQYSHATTPSLHTIPSTVTGPQYVQGAPTYCIAGGETLTSGYDAIVMRDETVTEPVLVRVKNALYTFAIRQASPKEAYIMVMPLGPAEDLECASHLGDYGPYIGKDCLKTTKTLATPVFPRPLVHLAVTRRQSNLVVVGVTNDCKIYILESVTVTETEITWGAMKRFEGQTCVQPAVVNVPRFDLVNGALSSPTECFRMYYAGDSLHIFEYINCVDGYATLSRVWDPTAGAYAVAKGAISAIAWPAPGDEMDQHNVYTLNGHLCTTMLAYVGDGSLRVTALNQTANSWTQFHTGITTYCPRTKIGLAFSFLRTSAGGYLDNYHPGHLWMMYNEILCGTKEERAASVIAATISAEFGLSYTTINLATKARLGHAWTYLKPNSSVSLYSDSRLQVPKGYITLANGATRLMARANGVSKDVFKVENEAQVMAAFACRPLKGNPVWDGYTTERISCPGTDEGRAWSPFGN